MFCFCALWLSAGQVVFTRLACQHHIFCGRKQEEKNDYCSISPKEVLLLLRVGYGSPQWFVPPVIINFLLIREYLYVFEWQWIGSSFPLIPFSLTPRFPGHSSKDVRKSTLARWRECWNTRKVRVGCVYHCFSSWWWQLQATHHERLASGSLAQSSQTPLLSSGPQPGLVLLSSYILPCKILMIIDPMKLWISSCQFPGPDSPRLLR